MLTVSTMIHKFDGTFIFTWAPKATRRWNLGLWCWICLCVLLFVALVAGQNVKSKACSVDFPWSRIGGTSSSLCGLSVGLTIQSTVQDLVSGSKFRHLRSFGIRSKFFLTKTTIVHYVMILCNFINTRFIQVQPNFAFNWCPRPLVTTVMIGGADFRRRWRSLKVTVWCVQYNLLRFQVPNLWSQCLLASKPSLENLCLWLWGSG